VSGHEEEDFAAMFEASIQAARLETGQTVEGTIVAIGAEVAFVDVGGKGEATIDIEELADPGGDLDVQVGDIVQGVVVSTRGGLKLSHRLARGAATRQRLHDAGLLLRCRPGLHTALQLRRDRVHGGVW